MRPTFQTGRGELIEAYLLDFDGDLYGQELCLEFVARLRGERRFDTAEALIEQMHRDVARTARAVRRRRATGAEGRALGVSATVTAAWPHHHRPQARDRREVRRERARHGKTEVQIALLTERINHLTEHLREQRTTTRAAAC